MLGRICDGELLKTLLTSWALSLSHNTIQACGIRLLVKLDGFFGFNFAPVASWTLLLSHHTMQIGEWIKLDRSYDVVLINMSVMSWVLFLSHHTIQIGLWIKLHKSYDSVLLKKSAMS